MKSSGRTSAANEITELVVAASKASETPYSELAKKYVSDSNFELFSINSPAFSLSLCDRSAVVKLF